MKIIEKTTLILFSTIMLVISLIACLLIFGWLDVKFIEQIVVNIISNPTSANIVLGLSIVFILLAIRCIFFGGESSDNGDYKSGILLESTNGKLLITKETIENLVNGVVKGFESAEEVTNKIELCEDNTVKVYVNLTVGENVIIKELSSNIQTKIKDAIKKTTDLEVKEVNIKIRNIEPTKDIIKE